MYIDALAQIIVPRISDFDGLSITQPVYEWDGVDYPQGPKILSWKHISLSIDEPQEYAKRYLPSDYIRTDWVWLKISDETLDNYDAFINNETPSHIGDKIDTANDSENQLETFLRLLLADVDGWVLAFVWQYDQIDGVYQLDVEDCIEKFRDNLMRNNKKQGFIVYK